MKHLLCRLFGHVFFEAVEIIHSHFIVSAVVWRCSTCGKIKIKDVIGIKP